MYLSGWPKIYSFYYIIQEVQTWQTRKCPYCQLVFPTSLIKTHMKNYCLKRGQASSIEAESTDDTSSCDTSVSEAETSGNYTGEEDILAPDFGEIGDDQDKSRGEGEELELSFTEQVIFYW